MACTLPEKELIRYFSRLGPLGLILREVDDRARSQIIVSLDRKTSETNWSMELTAPRESRLGAHHDVRR